MEAGESNGGRFADAMQYLVRSLDIVLDVECPDDLDEDYVKTPRWLDVVETAREALRIIDATEQRM